MVRGNIAERFEHEFPFMKPGMGDDGFFERGNDIIVKQNVQINGSGTVMNGPYPFQVLFN